MKHANIAADFSRVQVAVNTIRNILLSVYYQFVNRLINFIYCETQTVLRLLFELLKRGKGGTALVSGKSEFILRYRLN